MNLLEHFVMQHIQVSLLKAKLHRMSKHPGAQEARVELNLAPRVVDTEGDQLPVYQVSARLTCKGGGGDDPGPKFAAEVAYEVIYRQTAGEPIDVAQFSANHASLTRQLYPLLQQEMRSLLVRLGLEQLHLPFDLTARVDAPEQERVRLSTSLH